MTTSGMHAASNSCVCVCVYLSIYLYIHIYIYIYVYIYIYNMYVYTHTHIHTLTHTFHTHTHTHTHSLTYMHSHAQTHTHTLHTYMHTHTCIHIHTHMHTHTFPAQARFQICIVTKLSTHVATIPCIYACIYTHTHIFRRRKVSNLYLWPSWARQSTEPRIFTLIHQDPTSEELVRIYSHLHNDFFFSRYFFFSIKTPISNSGPKMLWIGLFSHRSVRILFVFYAKKKQSLCKWEYLSIFFCFTCLHLFVLHSQLMISSITSTHERIHVQIHITSAHKWIHVVHIQISSTHECIHTHTYVHTWAEY